MTARAVLAIRRELSRSSRGFLGAWLALVVTMPSTYLLIPTVAAVGYKIFHPHKPLEISGQAMWGVFAAGVFCVVVGPLFLAFRRHIVGPRFPFLRWGYLAVAAVGPAVALAFRFDPNPATSLTIAALFYEVPAFVGTLLYVAMARLLGGFGDEWPDRPRS